MPSSQELIKAYLKNTNPTKCKTSYKDKPLSYKTIQKMMRSEK
jgi:peptide methionine sulfoxide reductase MsrA